MKEYWIYVLGNRKKSVLYIGVTNNLIRRLYEHKNPSDTDSFTSKYKVNQLLYFESYSDINYALQREKQLKKWKREWKLKLIREKNPALKNFELV